MLQDQTEITVRYNEADPLGIVWHGHYLRYFEDGREAFGKIHGVSYLDFYRNGLAVPVVSVNCDYKRPLRYGDSVIVETILFLFQIAILETFILIREGHREGKRCTREGQSTTKWHHRRCWQKTRRNGTEMLQ